MSPTPLEAQAIYRLGLAWSETATILSRVVHKGASLSSDDRLMLDASSRACRHLRHELMAGREGTLARHLMRVTQPLYSRVALIDLLGRSEGALRSLGCGVPGAETLQRAQISLLVEFLSDCCLSLLRDLALSQVRAS